MRTTTSSSKKFQSAPGKKTASKKQNSLSKNRLSVFYGKQKKSTADKPTEKPQQVFEYYYDEYDEYLSS